MEKHECRKCGENLTELEPGLYHCNSARCRYQRLVARAKRVGRYMVRLNVPDSAWEESGTPRDPGAYLLTTILLNDHLAMHLEAIAVIPPHGKITHGLCKTCGHFGEDCTGDRTVAAGDELQDALERLERAATTEEPAPLLSTLTLNPDTPQAREYYVCATPYIY